MEAVPRRYRAASVPYVNARPLVSYFEALPEESTVEVIYDVPSRLPALLDRGSAHVVLASSVDSLLTPGRKIAGGLCIASRGPVLSVRLFSKVEPSEIRSLALDQSSLTSNALAQIVLKERYGVQPERMEPRPPDLRAMLESFDACVLIGDIGMRADGTGLRVLDLGEEWTRLTGLPFVWALWIGRDGLNEELASWLLRAREWSDLGADRASSSADGDASRRESLLRSISASSSWTLGEVWRYLMDTIVFDLGSRELEGLREFGRRLEALGLIEKCYFPQIVQPVPRASEFRTVLQ